MRSAARLLAAATVLLVGACTASPGASAVASGSASSAPAASPSIAAASAATVELTANPSAVPPAATPVGTTQTPWGRITDAVPAAFPVYPKAAPAGPPPDGAVSGAWLSKAPVSEVAAWYHDALLATNWAKVDDGGALEDGSHVLDAQGDLPECRAQVTVKPAGGSTMITVLYGAGCAGGSG